MATSAHMALLQRSGLLSDWNQLTASRPLRSFDQCQGLVIDDFFAISVESHQTPPSESRSAKAFRQAQAAYAKHGILGSPDKDVCGETSGKTIGAFVNSSKESIKNGMITVGAPIGKRLGLSFITMMLCRSPATTDVLHACLVGGWVSLMTYRRPMMSVLDSSFKLVDSQSINQNAPKVIRLPRKTASELVLLSVLVPLMLTDIAAPHSPFVYCTDASSTKGAICRAEIASERAEILWRVSRSKGAYTRLLTPAEATLRHLGELEEKEIEPERQVDRPIAYHFEFIEVFAGAAVITSAVADLGVVVGPPIELTFSPAYGLKESLVIQWLTCLLQDKRLLSFFLAPPCTTFSITRRPSLRDADYPFGYDPWDEQTQTGNLLANRSGQMMKVGKENDAAGLWETPFSSKMKHLPAWKAIRRLCCAAEVRTDSCRFGSIHQKGFRFLSINMKLDSIAKRCICRTKHVPVQGKYTSKSATYTPQLAEAIARCFLHAIKSVQAFRHDQLDIEVKGLESLLVNDVAVSSRWESLSSWSFRKDGHINILEMSVVFRLACILARTGKPIRVTNMVDSNVVRGALNKGRSSSLGLGSLVRKYTALCVSAGLYFSLPYVPTRSNASDDPTRDRQVREASNSIISDDWSVDNLFDLAALPKVRRWAANWMRLVVCYLGPSVLYLHQRSLYRQVSGGIRLLEDYQFQHSLKFDSTLGFPGEGPLQCPPFFLLVLLGSNGLIYVDLFSRGLSGFCLTTLVILSSTIDLFQPMDFASRASAFRGGGARWMRLLLLCQLVSGAMAMPMFPKTSGETAKARLRAARGPLPEGRPVLPSTGSARQRYLLAFDEWAGEQKIDFRNLLDNHHICIDQINEILSTYGRALYNSGKSYNQYAETLNGITSIKPAVRRMLQGAWDVGYSWIRAEPSSHHTALPPQILLAMISVSLVWGWVAFAGCLALGFGALLRPGEIFAATRKHLFLPEDAIGFIDYALISIDEPKSRFTNARRQTAKLDARDLLEVVIFCFGPLQAHQKLWPFSGQTFRERFKSVLRALHIPTETIQHLKPLDPGSLRAGGATFLINTTENGELCRRRGRWANHKMMEVYVQELSSLAYMKHLDGDCLERIKAFALIFLNIFEQVKSFRAAQVPVSVWYILFSR